MKTMNEEKLARMAEFIHRYIEENNGRSPKFSEILAYMDMSNSVGYRYLTVLRDRGVIEYKGRDTLRVKGQESMHSGAHRIPIFIRKGCRSSQFCRPGSAPATVQGKDHFPIRKIRHKEISFP